MPITVPLRPVMAAKISLFHECSNAKCAISIAVRHTVRPIPKLATCTSRSSAITKMLLLLRFPFCLTLRDRAFRIQPIIKHHSSFQFLLFLWGLLFWGVLLRLRILRHCGRFQLVLWVVGRFLLAHRSRICFDSFYLACSFPIVLHTCSTSEEQFKNYPLPKNKNRQAKHRNLFETD